MNTSISLDKSFLWEEGAQGDNNLVQCLRNSESSDSQRTSISDMSSCESCSQTQEHRSSIRQENSSCSSRSDRQSSFSQGSEDSSHEYISPSYRSPTPLKQMPLTQKKPQKKNTLCVFASKGGMRYPWKSSCLKAQSLKHPRSNGEKDFVVQRILSARLHRINELKNELFDQQRKLEDINVENKLLKRLQHRHIKALRQFESTENDLHHLITSHNSEVRSLRGLLRKSQEQERNVSKKLKEAETELLKTKDSLEKLQKLSEDKSLAEREELNIKVLALTVQLEDKEKIMKGLEKQLQLNAACFTRQLAAENRKTMDARETSKKLQLEMSVLLQKLKEKERELDIKNIYANRMPKDLQKYEISTHQKGLNLNKAVQTESHMFMTQDQKQDPEDGTPLPSEENWKEEVNPEVSNMAQTQEDSQWSHGDLLKEERRIMEEHFEFMERQRKRKEDQEREAEMLRGEAERLVNNTESEKVEASQGENSWDQEPLDENNMNKRLNKEESYTKSKIRNIPVRLRRHYIFTEATENLHQGFPATGPISSISNKIPINNQTKEVDLELETSCGRYGASFSKTSKSITLEQKSREWKDGTKVSATLKDRKNILMEELFGPGYSLKSGFSNPHARGVDEEQTSLEAKNEHSSCIKHKAELTF